MIELLQEATDRHIDRRVIPAKRAWLDLDIPKGYHLAPQLLPSRRLARFLRPSSVPS